MSIAQSKSESGPGTGILQTCDSGMKSSLRICPTRSLQILPRMQSISLAFAKSISPSLLNRMRHSAEQCTSLADKLDLNKICLSHPGNGLQLHRNHPHVRKSQMPGVCWKLPRVIVSVSYWLWTQSESASKGCSFQNVCLLPFLRDELKPRRWGHTTDNTKTTTTGSAISKHAAIES